MRITTRKSLSPRDSPPQDFSTFLHLVGILYFSFSPHPNRPLNQIKQILVDNRASQDQVQDRYLTIFSNIWDAKLFPPKTAAVVHNACPLPRNNRKNTLIIINNHGKTSPLVLTRKNMKELQKRGLKLINSIHQSLKEKEETDWGTFKHT